MNITLLGPQRKVSAARTAVAELMPDGPIATINAGWQERETDTAEIAEVLGGRMLNLELYRRWLDVLACDAEYQQAEQRLTKLLAEIQSVYALRLHHAMSAIEALRRRAEVPTVQDAAMHDALEAVRQLDRWHLALAAEARDDFDAQTRMSERDSIVGHRGDVASLAAQAGGFVVAGGHVGVLLHVLHVFAVAPLIKEPTVAWSAGAMALSDRVVLFNDRAPHGYQHAQLYAEGLATYHGILPLPHGRRRLRMDDSDRLGLMARRFAPRVCLLLPDGQRFDLVEDEPLPAAARWLSVSGGTAGPEDGR